MLPGRTTATDHTATDHTATDHTASEVVADSGKYPACAGTRTRPFGYVVYPRSHGTSSGAYRYARKIALVTSGKSLAASSS
jgi:hypothetical protein